MIKPLQYLLTAIMISVPAFSQTDEKVKYIYSSAEIFQIMEGSKVVYMPKIVEEFKVEDEKKYPNISDQLYIVHEGSSVSVMEYELSEPGKEHFKFAENEYKQKNYDKAIPLYMKILDTDSNYYKAYTLIGDMYYLKADYDSAEYYFKYAIEKNFIDYQAHWFLADTYMKKEELDKAVEHITIAHLLNRNHENLKLVLMKIREIDGDEWADWEIEPECRTFENEEGVVVEATEKWLGYAMAEAVWKYEPGFSERILGKKYDENDPCYQKEAGCIAANLDIIPEISEIIEDGLFQQMVYYERISKIAPMSLLLLPEDMFQRIVEYVSEYH